MIIKSVCEINRDLFYALWDVANNSKPTSAQDCKLIFPTRRNKDTRISEQESRVLFCNLLNNTEYFYSVETPTEEMYKQKGKKHRSANSDLSLYTQTNDDFKPVLNVELKAHTAKKEDIRKDIEKLMRENVPGNWFHTLKNIRRDTLPAIFKRIVYSIKDTKEGFSCEKQSIIFSFCVLERQWGCLKLFECDPSTKEFDKYVDDFFTLEYSINKGIHVHNKAGWEIISRSGNNKID